MADCFDDVLWHRHFRVPRSAMEMVNDLVKEDLQAAHGPNRKDTIPVFKRTCIAVYTLAHCAEFSCIGLSFGVSKQTVCRYLRRFCIALVKHRSRFIAMPAKEEAIRLANRMEERFKYPQAIGAIDGCHFAITPPSDGMADFLNRKMWPSFNMQAVVDIDLKFRDVCVQHPGSYHDAAVFRES